MVHKHKSKKRTRLDGDGLFSKGISYITEKFVSNKMPDKLKKQLNTIGNIPIRKIWYSRKPINSGIKKALNFLTLGKFNKKQDDLKYDGVYHDSVVIELNNGNKYRLEKNHVIELNTYRYSDTDKLTEMPMKDSLTINTLLNNVNKEPNLYKYDHRDNNCQNFASNISKDSGLNKGKDNDIQNSKELTKALPDTVNDVMNTITNVASIVNPFTENLIGSGIRKTGLGLRKGRKKIYKI